MAKFTAMETQLVIFQCGPIRLADLSERMTGIRNFELTAVALPNDIFLGHYFYVIKHFGQLGTILNKLSQI